MHEDFWELFFNPTPRFLFSVVYALEENEYRKYLRKREMKVEAVEDAVTAVKEFETRLRAEGKSLESASLEDLKEYISGLISAGLNTEDRLISLSRYFWLTKRNDLFSYFAAVLGGRGVYDSIGGRLSGVAGEGKRGEVFDGFTQPPLGSPPDAYPACTKQLLERLGASLTPGQVKAVLAGNHHRIPAEHFAEMAKRWEKAATMEEFLKGEHGRLVAELEETMKSGRLWYEQVITPEVVEFVRNDQTIQNGVLVGDKVLKSKIPFAPDKWLKEKDPKMRRYYACHCQLARDAILSETSRPLGTFCYCSAGYEKLPLEVVLGVPLEVEVLENVLDGGERCRFAVKIPKEKLK
ncbi:MAG: hypothetical protein NTV61_07275 [Candidatus Bathyarchaeota archaeon]|nr:hypothetical protein [Candidatus Bathyarchaeota archaeon]